MFIKGTFTFDTETLILISYFANLRARYKAAVAWLRGQHAALLAGKPVDAELRTYDASGYRTLWQTWPDG
jgi:hypothetical protein